MVSISSRRLLIVERVSEEMLERAKTSTAAIDAYFNASKQVKKFELVCCLFVCLVGC